MRGGANLESIIFLNRTSQTVLEVMWDGREAHTLMNTRINAFITIQKQSTGRIDGVNQLKRVSEVD